MHYIRGWLISLVAYIATYIGTMGLILYYYGERFLNEETKDLVIDFVYYFTSFAWFAACAVFAVRTHELTERQSFHAKYQLQREIAEWKKLLRDIPEPIIFAQRGQISFFNRAVLELFDIVSGYPTEGNNNSMQTNLEATERCPDPEETFRAQTNEVIGHLVDLKQHGSQKTLRDVIEEASHGGLMGETSFVYKTKEKKRFLTIKSVKTAGTQDEEGVVEYILHDVTALRELESGKAKDQCFDILLATASHDIRTPLNAILGVIDSLSDFANTASTKEQIAVAHDCGKRMLYYLQGLTFIRQTNTGKLVATKRLFSPDEAAREILSCSELSAKLKGLTLDFSVSSDVPTVICSDKEMYKIVLENLIENAMKYTFTGGVKIGVEFEKTSNRLWTTVSDTGIGMSDKQQRNVGMLFKKEKAKRNKFNPQGLGLGLFLVKTLVQKLDGELSIRSTENQGTVTSFAVTNYPASEACCERVQPELSPVVSVALSPSLRHTHALMPETCGCAKVLLVDDDPFNLVVLSAYLEAVHVKADRAENGQIALRMIEEKADMQECCNGYSVVFMDINMPVMDGVQATEKITEMMRCRKIPHCYVVAVTAATDLDKPDVYASYIAKGFAELRNILYKLMCCSFQARAEGRLRSDTNAVFKGEHCESAAIICVDEFSLPTGNLHCLSQNRAFTLCAVLSFVLSP
ncbi:MAG: hybrid sensor histidine kinase/response regulator, partial [Candidatus Pacebacteria bacterium]|nr:hybrid sensor histidine kinase/response regulator [Candidatus Paceibacterota bacterium]